MLPPITTRGMPRGLFEGFGEGGMVGKSCAASDFMDGDVGRGEEVPGCGETEGVLIREWRHTEGTFEGTMEVAGGATCVGGKIGDHQAFAEPLFDPLTRVQQRGADMGDRRAGIVHIGKEKGEDIEETSQPPEWRESMAFATTVGKPREEAGEVLYLPMCQVSGGGGGSDRHAGIGGQDLMPR